VVDGRTIKNVDFMNFKAYAAAFYQYMGNYHSFGAMKFKPNVDEGKFRMILMRHPLFTAKTKKGQLYRKVVNDVYPQVKEQMFNTKMPYKQLGYPDDGGTTAYLSYNMKKEDLKLVRDFMKSQNMSLLNTRAFKSAENHYIITVGSIDDKLTRKGIKYNGNVFDLKYGEFGGYLKEVNMYLKKAMNFTANDHQRRMLQLYQQHFMWGDIEDHKQSQREWVKDKQPAVESNLGWVEKYVDPENQRAMWSGWVAVVDKEKSKVYTQLVNKSHAILDHLPWNKTLEKTRFMAPDFSSLDVLTFAGDRLPSGINIPNYYDIRENDGFKNVVFQSKDDAMKPKLTVFPYTLTHVKSKTESDFINQYQQQAYQVQVAGHELFGHGSGKMIYRDEKTGKCPVSAVAPIEPNKTLNNCYEKGETYSSRFGDIGTSFEECRADLSGLWLEEFPEMYETFNWTAKDNDILRWSSMLGEARKGILGLESSFNEDKHRWNQAHTQGAYVITKFIMGNQ